LLHKNRRWSVVDRDHATLANELTSNTWTLCTGFRCNGYLFLNDSTSEDAAQEYAVIRESDGKQVESITFTWCTPNEALEYITQAVSGQYDNQAWESGIDMSAQVQSCEHHGRCPLCM